MPALQPFSACCASVPMHCASVSQTILPLRRNACMVRNRRSRGATFWLRRRSDVNRKDESPMKLRRILLAAACAMLAFAAPALAEDDPEKGLEQYRQLRRDGHG